MASETPKCGVRRRLVDKSLGRVLTSRMRRALVSGPAFIVNKEHDCKPRVNVSGEEAVSAHFVFEHFAAQQRIVLAY